jgi:arylsulfatase A-like enzyme
MHRRHFLASAGVVGALSLAGRVRAKTRDSKPNILFILADDLGYADLSCYGRRDYETPVLDGLADEGVRFTQAYSNSSVCSPTRVALATGRYQYRLAAGLPEPIGAAGAAAEGTDGLPSDHPTLASLLRATGYRTALLGKWHLGELPKFSPLKSGYEQFFGIYGGGVDYVSHMAPGPGKKDLYNGEQPVEENGYLTDILTTKAVEYVSDARRHDAPFLLSLHYTAPHWPWQAPGDGPTPQDRVLFDLPGGSPSTYAKMVQSLDSGIGRVLRALRQSGQERSTLVIFTSDNGGERFSDTWPFAGQKMDLLEGGIRVPLIARWKGEIPSRRVTNQLVITMDWLPTLLSLAGTSPDTAYPSDGMDLTATLRSPEKATARTLYWRMLHRRQKALRVGDWKYLSINGNEFLFDLATDARERANRRESEPARFAEMKTTWDAWNQTMLPLPSSERPYFTGKDLAGYHD